MIGSLLDTRQVYPGLVLYELDGSGGDPYSLAEYEADDLCTYVELA